MTATWASLGGLLVSIVALWRSGRSPVLTLRTELRKEIAELNLALNDLAATIPVAVQSRARTAAATGQSGALQHFQNEAEADRVKVEGLRAQLNGIARLPKLAGYGDIEDRTVTAREVRVGVRALREKYVAAAEADGEVRKHLRDAAVDRLNRSRS